MLALLCDDGWDACIRDFLLEALTPAVEALIALIFDPILSALAEAIGALMATIGTFWVFVDTPAVGNAQGEPASATVGWLWQHTSWLAVFAAIIGVIVAGVQMAWSQRGDSARDLLRSLLTLAVASTLAIGIAQLLISIGDTFSKCIVATALDTDRTTGWTCSLGDANPQAFGDAMTVMLGLSVASAGTLGVGLMITIAVITLLASVIQIVLMVIRYAMLILLLGVLPVAAAATNTEMGKGWFLRILSWLTAFILYKPVAALIYATAIKLTGAAFEEGERNGPLAFTSQEAGPAIMNMVTGVTMLVLALFAMPALMRFIAPMVSATAGGAGAGGLAAKLVGADKLADKASESTSSESDGPSGARNVGRPSNSSSQNSGPRGSETRNRG